MVKSKDISEKTIDIVAYLVLAVMAISCILPILHTVSVSFSDTAAAMAGQVTFWPVKFTTSSYQAILEDKQFFTSLGNSLERVLLGGIINISLTVLMAFPLSKSKRFFPQRNIYMWFLVFTMLFHGGLIPSYLLVTNLHLLDSIWALVLPGAVPVFNVIILMNFFKGIPDELDEAARIDGANPWSTLFKIYLPLAGPCLATVTLFSIVGHWNAFFDGIIYMKTSAKIPLQTYIQSLVVEIRDMSMLTPEEIVELNKVSSKTFNAAKVFVTMVPVLMVYPFLQKYFVTGLVMGSVKG
jgi:ABC-type glycerol-3-phosphate transport system permease component